MRRRKSTYLRDFVLSVDMITNMEINGVNHNRFMSKLSTRFSIFDSANIAVEIGNRYKRVSIHNDVRKANNSVGEITGMEEKVNGR